MAFERFTRDARADGSQRTRTGAHARPPRRRGGAPAAGARRPSRVSSAGSRPRPARGCPRRRGGAEPCVGRSRRRRTRAVGRRTSAAQTPVRYLGQAVATTRDEGGGRARRPAPDRRARFAGRARRRARPRAARVGDRRDRRRTVARAAMSATPAPDRAPRGSRRRSSAGSGRRRRRRRAPCSTDRRDRGRRRRRPPRSASGGSRPPTDQVVSATASIRDKSAAGRAPQSRQESRRARSRVSMARNGRQVRGAGDTAHGQRARNRPAALRAGPRAQIIVDA